MVEDGVAIECAPHLEVQLEQPAQLHQSTAPARLTSEQPVCHALGIVPDTTHACGLSALVPIKQQAISDLVRFAADIDVLQVYRLALLSYHSSSSAAPSRPVLCFDAGSKVNHFSSMASAPVEADSKPWDPPSSTHPTCLR